MAPLHEDAAARRTNLTLVDENAKERAIDGRFPIRVGKENVGGLTP